MNDLLQDILANPYHSLLVVANLILIESLLSVDNAAVLATMVMRLPQAQRSRALKFGILGAYLFRGACLLLASFLVGIWWLKALGGIYLLYLSIGWWVKKNRAGNVAGVAPPGFRLFKAVVGRIGNFWATVVSVEIMDLAFSLDNVFAAVAFSKNILLIITGVFIGILAMRFVAQGFVKLMERYAFLEGCAFAVIGILGVKLTLSLYEHFKPGGEIATMLKSEQIDWMTSAVTIGIFFIPVLTSTLFNWPAKKKN